MFRKFDRWDWAEFAFLGLVSLVLPVVATVHLWLNRNV